MADVLDQSEVDALLNAVSSGEVATEAGDHSGVGEEDSSASVGIRTS